MPKIVALHGASNSGKDVIGDHLVSKFGFTRKAFADALYEEIAKIFEVDVRYLKQRVNKAYPQPLLAALYCTNPDYRDYLLRSVGMFDPQTSRFHMEQYSLWKQPTNTWAQIVSKEILSLPLDKSVVVTDLRTYSDLREWTALNKTASMTGTLSY